MDTRELLIHLEAGALTVDEVMREIGSRVTSDDVERAATLAWNEGIERAVYEMETVGVGTDDEALLITTVVAAIRALKRTA